MGMGNKNIKKHSTIKGDPAVETGTQRKDTETTQPSDLEFSPLPLLECIGLTLPEQVLHVACTQVQKIAYCAEHSRSTVWQALQLSISLDEWIARYTADPALGLIELANFFVECAGLQNVRTRPNVIM